MSKIMQMCADEIAGYLKRIAELEKQLADLEEENETFKKALRGEIFINYEIPMENERLKQQLAEKEKQETERMMKFEKECQEYYKSKDFAIEQLEKVKWLVEDIDYDFGDDNNIRRDFVIKKINKQIKELRGQE